MAHLQPLKFVQVLPKAKHTATVFFMHGLGDSGAGWAPVADMLSEKLPHVKWILPNARTQPVTVNWGMDSPSWFDIYTLGDRSMPQREDERGMLDSVVSIEALVADEIEKNNIPSERIIVGGFSQGGALSMLFGTTTKHKLGGIVVLSAWLPLRDKIASMVSPELKTLPIFQGHGVQDAIVQCEWGRLSGEYLKEKFGVKVAEPGKLKEGGIIFKTYQGLLHGASDEEIEDLSKWLQEVLPNN
ncbi:acyl-protein thioesterase 1 [Dacryopinax primogenitus]|uniref:Acyl-protein thioesterase 1 n=1 Tax=Dacryopinax primogenitus (strain DJM 731) TaxID=1858805 RepID=M5GH05_DACPD|nr:acyl-protein thioesterase 1 [Dacryopinax primogenitus]EJU06398.1 acyl-protein thioesterase 1 [Dacryopinax primogenitus]